MASQTTVESIDYLFDSAVARGAKDSMLCRASSQLDQALNRAARRG